MNTHTRNEEPTELDLDPTASEPPQRRLRNSEAVLSTGAWRARADAAHADKADPEALEWQPEKTLRQRITRAASVPAVAGVAVFAVAVIIAILMTVLQSGAGIDTPAASATGEGDAAAGSVTDAMKEARPTDASNAPVFVHVVGEVVTPGVVELPSGARTADAIAAAGGATPLAALEGVNLARVVADGEQLLIPSTEELAVGAPLSPPPEAGGPGGAASNSGGVVNLNQADATLLQTLPRVGPALAQRILDWRQANGSFTSIEQLMDVPGIGPKIFEGMKELVTA